MRSTVVLLLSLLLLGGCINIPFQKALNTSGQPQNSTIEFIAPAPNATQQENATVQNTTRYDFSKTHSDNGKLIVYSFYSTRCPICNDMQPFMEALGKKYENVTEWRGFNIVFEPDRDYYFQFYKDYNVSQSRSGTPTVMVNGTILWGKYEINDSLEKIISASVIPAGAAQP